MIATLYLLLFGEAYQVPGKVLVTDVSPYSVTTADGSPYEVQVTDEIADG